MLLPGLQASRVRRQACELLCRYLGGDVSLVDEVYQLRGLQEELAVRAPDDPMRVFGEEVAQREAASGGMAGEQLRRMCTEIVARALPTVLDKITEHIDKRLAHLEGRQRINLNVRAPKRDGPYSPPIARNISGRPYPVAKYLDQKQREDPSWQGVRRSFAPTFSMCVQILKKNKLKEEGVMLKLLVVKDSMSKWIGAHVVSVKGVGGRLIL